MNREMYVFVNSCSYLSICLFYLVSPQSLPNGILLFIRFQYIQYINSFLFQKIFCHVKIDII